MFRHRPALAAELLSEVFGMRLPEHQQVRLSAAESVELAPVEYRADAVMVLAGAAGAALAVVVEIQLRRDADKQWTWPLYVSAVRNRLRCPVVLLVVCVDAGVADWAAIPIGLGNPGAVLPPSVLGPGLVPVLVDPVRAAASPELSVFSALAHGGGPGGAGVLDVLAQALSRVEVDHAVLYARLVLAALPEAARAHLEALMSTETFEYQSEFTRRLERKGRAEGEARGRAEGAARGEARGEAKGRARSLLAVLEARHIEVPAAASARITTCTDLDQLERWIRRAVTATSIDDIDI